MNNFINPHITKRIIIGTKSASRRKLFHSLNLSFKFRSANIDERKVRNINNKIIKKDLSETKINFNENSHQLIQSYVNKNFSIIKSAVGCYNIEGPGKKFFENIDGSFYNIIGLDIIKFLRSLKSI